jgi:hypothetical protein
MFNFEQKMDRIAQLAQKIHAKEPAFTDAHKQAAITKAEIEQTILKLIMDKVTLKIIFCSLLYFWLKIEALANDISEQQFDKWPTPIEVIAIKIIETINLVVNNLPDPSTSDDLKELGTHVNAIKANIPNEDNIYIPPEELSKHAINASTQIFMIISNLLKGGSTYPEKIYLDFL